ncbi:MAG TPA: Hsp20 family protein [Bryobacteraceae bacterium]|nr:Hsp20 family protein [Bryobacteraceae bacterium]
MPVLKYHPFAPDLEDLPTGLRVFQDSVARLLGDTASRPWTPPVDIFETENELILKADVPDVDQNNIDIRFENGTLTLKGERKFTNGEQLSAHRIERSYGAFSRSFALPESFDADRIRAEYRNGVLSVTVPKKEIAKPRSIKVEVSNN